VTSNSELRIVISAIDRFTVQVGEVWRRFDALAWAISPIGRWRSDWQASYFDPQAARRIIRLRGLG